MSFPTTAIDPSGRVVSVLVTPDGKLVTDQQPKPPVVLPVQQASLVLNSNNQVRIA